MRRSPPPFEESVPRDRTGMEEGPAREEDPPSIDPAGDATPSGESQDFVGFTPPQEAVPEMEVDPDSVLDPEFLEALGKNPEVQAPPPPPLHTSIVRRWTDHVVKGLPADVFTSLRETYPLPPNFPRINPPQLNPEIVASIGERHKATDAGYVTIQRQLATAVTSLGRGLAAVCEQGEAARSVVRPSYLAFCDTGRALTALFFDINRTRRRLIMSVCDPTLAQISKDVPPSTFLFGDDLVTRLRERAGLEKAAKGMVSLKKPPPVPPRAQQSARSNNPTYTAPQNQGNAQSHAASRGGQPKPVAQSPRQDNGRSRGRGQKRHRGQSGNRGRANYGYRQ